MAYRPCAFCGIRFLGNAVTGYVSYSNNGERNAFRQKMCPKCAASVLGDMIGRAMIKDEEIVDWPETCCICGIKVDDDVVLTWATFYRGQDRKDFVWPTCPADSITLRAVLTENAEPLETPTSHTWVGEGGAPRPDPQPVGKRGGLPW